jgi:membrane-bound metal-dependent hydrolase YbcI (DUF457 family)
MGRTHALTGWCAGAALAPVVGLGSLPGVVVFATATAGYALLPDLDHPGASASRLFGPITGLLCRILRAMSAAAYKATKGPRDEDSPGTHRHLTHTVVFALVLGSAAAIASHTAGRWAVAGIAGFGLLLAVAALGDWLLLLAAGGGYLLDRQVDALTVLQHAAGPIGLAVAAGCITHCAGDALTRSGCPFLWPIPIAGETWYEIRPPASLRFRTGGLVERILIAPAAVLLGLFLVPGCWTHVRDALSHHSVSNRLTGSGTNRVIASNRHADDRQIRQAAWPQREDHAHGSHQGSVQTQAELGCCNRVCPRQARGKSGPHPWWSSVGHLGSGVSRRATDARRPGDHRRNPALGGGTCTSPAGQHAPARHGDECLDADTKRPRPTAGAFRISPYLRITPEQAPNPSA